MESKAGKAVFAYSALVKGNEIQYWALLLYPQTHTFNSNFLPMFCRKLATYHMISRLNIFLFPIVLQKSLCLRILYVKPWKL